MFSDFVERLLCKMPRIYLACLGLRGQYNCEKAAYLKLIRPGFVLVEVGANEGYFTRLFGKLVGKNGHVLAFEPIKQTRDRLTKNVNNIEWVKVLPYAISDKIGEFPMFIPGSTHGQASLRKHSDPEWGEEGSTYTENVRCSPLGQLDDIKYLDKIDFMKVDVEGAELEVLKGAQEILKRDHPVLHLEIEERWMNSFGYGAAEIESFLRRIGYNAFMTYDREWITLKSLVGIGSVNIVCSEFPLV